MGWMIPDATGDCFLNVDTIAVIKVSSVTNSSSETVGFVVHAIHTDGTRSTLYQPNPKFEVGLQLETCRRECARIIRNLKKGA